MRRIVLTLLLIAAASPARAEDVSACEYAQQENLDVAARECRKYAEKGDANAQLWLGHMYTYGWGGVPKNEREAQKWYRMAMKSYRKAAEQGNVSAQKKLGQMYRMGYGVDTSDWRYLRSLLISLAIFFGFPIAALLFYRQLKIPSAKKLQGESSGTHYERVVLRHSELSDYSWILALVTFLVSPVLIWLAVLVSGVPDSKVDHFALAAFWSLPAIWLAVVLFKTFVTNRTISKMRAERTLRLSPTLTSFVNSHPGLLDQVLAFDSIPLASKLVNELNKLDDRAIRIGPIALKSLYDRARQLDEQGQRFVARHEKVAEYRDTDGSESCWSCAHGEYCPGTSHQPGTEFVGYAHVFSLEEGVSDLPPL